MHKNNKKIYLDYAGATPIDPKIIKKISSYQKEFFANPSAIHQTGVSVRKEIEKSRLKIATLMNAHSDEIIFTGSGTESIALAILGTVYASQKEYFPKSSDKGDKNSVGSFKNNLFATHLPHIVTTNIEHPAVLENCKMLEEKGLAEVTYVPVKENGIIDPKDIRQALKENTVLVSVMYANNEIGTIQPIREIAKEIRHYKRNKSLQKYSSEMPGYFSTEKFLELTPSRSLGISEKYFLRDKFSSFPFFHTDACQAMNYLETENIERLGVDFLSFNSSKIYGPKGIGVLYKKRGIEILPLYEGGGQEFNLRSGTENISSIAGTAIALENVCKIKGKESARLIKIRDYVIDRLLKINIPPFKIILNGDLKKRLPNNINISVSNISSELLVVELDALNIQVSEKSACQSEKENNSYVISALRKTCNRKKGSVEGSLRITLGQLTNKGDMDKFVSALKNILEKYKEWE